jgi:hypothetical protein
LTSACWLPGYGCGSVSVPWLSASQTQFTLSPGARTTVTVTLNAGDPSVTQPGTYTAALDATADTPCLTPSVRVTLKARPPASWGKITGTVSGTDCSGTTTMLSGATVEISGSTASYTLSTRQQRDLRALARSGPEPADSHCRRRQLADRPGHGHHQGGKDGHSELHADTIVVLGTIASGRTAR